MTDLIYASINGIQLRDMVELDYEDEPLYSGKIYLDDKEVGSFVEAPDQPMKIDIFAAYQQVLNARINDYLVEVADDGEHLDRELFFVDLIQLQSYLELYKESVAEGYPYLIVNYGDTQIDFYSAEDEEQVEEVVNYNKLTTYQVYDSLDLFVITC